MDLPADTLKIREICIGQFPRDPGKPGSEIIAIVNQVDAARFMADPRRLEQEAPGGGHDGSKRGQVFR
jgi:hypothetical protein